MIKSRKQICDRCGKEIKTNIIYKTNYGYIKIKRFFNFGQKESRDETYDCNYELCHNCINEFKNWLKDGNI